MKVIKRDGRAVEYNSEKINIAIEKANMEVCKEERATKNEIAKIINYIESMDKKRILVEDIQDIIEQKLMEFGKYDLAKKYIVYRYTRALVRKQNTTDESILGLIKNINNISIDSKEKSVIASVQRDFIASEVSKDLTRRILLPEKITKADDEGVLHFHAMEYFLQPIINSSFVNIEDMLDNGTIINNKEIVPPQNFLTACIVLAQIIASVATSQYGEQYINIRHLGKYLRKSCKTLEVELKNLEDSGANKEAIDAIITSRLKSEISDGIQAINLQINSLINVPKNKYVVGFILDNNETDEYYKENKLIIEELLKQKIENCEIIETSSNKKKYQCAGYFNYGIVSINLPQIALSIVENEKEFWEKLNERSELCYEALMCRHYALLGTVSDVSPIHWQSGAIARLHPGERIDKLLKDGYSSLSLGYVGLDEMAELLVVKLSLDDKAKDDFKNRTEKFLEDKVKSWKKLTGLEFIAEEVVGTEANYKFYEIDKNKYGKVLNECNGKISY
ncbi:MAG: hypothetical protein IKD76_06610 [Clostridia bacterium]|nr:hypothetical protein [Clostridia bacterium]